MYRQRRDSDLNMCNWISQGPHKSRHRSRSRRDHGQIDGKQIVATVSSRIVGIRRRMEGMTTCSQDQTRHTMNKKTKGWREKVGANRVSHTFTVTFQCSCVIKTKMLNWNRRRFERTRGEGGGRQRYRHVEGDVPICIRNKGEEHEASSKENEKSCSRAKCEGGSKKNEKDAESESNGANSSSTEANQTTSETRSEKYITFIVLQRMWGRWTQVNELNEELTQEVEGYRLDAFLISETWRASNAEIWETARTHIFHGSWKIREQTRSWNSGEQEVAKTYQLDRLQLRTRHMNVDHSPTTLKRYTDQSRNSRNPKRTTYKLWEETSMRNWHQELVLNVSVLDRTHLKRELREETGWSNVRWYKTSQHWTRCTEERLKSKLPTGPRKVQKNSWTTHWWTGTYVLQQRRWSKRHDPQGKRPQKCCGTLCDYNTKEGSLTKKQTSPRRKTKQQRAQRANTMKKTEIRWSKQIPRALRRTRKKNQAWSRSHHTEAENDWVFDNVEAIRRSYRRSSRSITPLERRRKRRSCSEDAIWKTCCGMKTRTPQSPSSNVRMADLLWKTQQHAIRMKTRTPLQEQSKLKADSLLKQQQHAIVVKTHAAAAASKEKSKENRSYVEVARKSKWKDQWRRRRDQKPHWGEAKHCERRQTPTERLEQEDQKKCIRDR